MYVGHTFNLYIRTVQHKSSCNNPNCKEYKVKSYQVICANSGFNNLNIEAVENYTECSSLEDARKKERYWIQHLHANLNRYCPIRTSDERKEPFKELSKQWNINNPEYFKKWENNNKERRREYKKEYMKEYNKYKEYQKEYYIINKLQQTQEQQQQQATNNITYNIINLTINN